MVVRADPATWEPERRARAIARKVTAAVHRVSPAGLGRWDGAWPIVADPSDAFLDALHAWETAGAPLPVPEHVRAAGDALVRAWLDAAAAWDAQGRPETWGAAERAEASR
jgi:hypothetical protein